MNWFGKLIPRNTSRVSLVHTVPTFSINCASRNQVLSFVSWQGGPGLQTNSRTG